MNTRDVARIVDPQLMDVRAHCLKCGADFHVAWGSCDCPEPETVECVRCKRTGSPDDESLVEVKGVGIVGDECLYDDDVVL